MSPIRADQPNRGIANATELGKTLSLENLLGMPSGANKENKKKSRFYFDSPNTAALVYHRVAESLQCKPSTDGFQPHGQSS